MSEIFINCFVNPCYEVSNLGRIRNKSTGVFLKGHLNNKGYRRVELNDKKKYFLGRIIYQSFNLNDDMDGLQIDYINQNKDDNKLINLRRCTFSENKGNMTQLINNKLGHKNITFHQNGYLCTIVKKPNRVSKWFKNLDDAINFRNMMIIQYYGVFAST
jgi:hypothetical protein